MKWRKFKEETPDIGELILVYCAKERFIYSRWETHIYSEPIQDMFPFWVRLTHPEFDKEKMKRHLSLAYADQDYE